MRVAFPMRVDVFDKPGGDLLQMQKYLEVGQHLAETGVGGFTGEVLHALDADLSHFDIVHLTNLDRPVELYHFYLAAKAAGKPIVFSTIHHSYREIASYERKGRGGIAGALAGILGFQTIEYARSLFRSLRYPQLLQPTLLTLLRDMRQCQVAVLRNVDKVLVMTSKEQADIQADFGPIDAVHFALLRNGFESCSSQEVARNIDVCVVGRVEARKNQIAIVHALSRLGLRGTFVGRENPNHAAYCKRFKKAVNTAGCEFLDGVDHDEVVALLKRSKVHVSASWFEVSSLVDLEAYFAGCSVVSSLCGGTLETLGDRAIYIDPSRPESISEGIAAAMERHHAAAGPGTIDETLVDTWVQIGAQLASTYRKLLAAPE